MPALAPLADFAPPPELTDFEKAVKSETYERGVHFYLDDYRFDDKIWLRFERYVERLARFACVLTPDFSLYLDMPYPPKINNVWRSRQIGALLQAAGATVVPTLQWAERASFDYCFDGLPVGSVVSISTVGVMRNPLSRKVFLEGFDAAMERLAPSTVLLYGSRPKECDFGSARVVQYANTHYRWADERRKAKKGKRGGRDGE
ncbi:MAG: DUF4417 domain-containing protein [Thermoguttaceae bacterium]|nr:DUF4417 domain-containing protein [Thermoguttaceae bacterium]